MPENRQKGCFMALERSVKCGICGKPANSFVHCDLIRGLACMQCCEQCVHSHKFEGVTRCAYPLIKRNKKSD